MTINTIYLNLLKFLTVAFVIGFIAYVANANDVIIDLEPFPACTSCLPEASDTTQPDIITNTGSAQSPLFPDLPKISLGGNGIISVAVLNPDLTNFDSVRFAIVEVADLKIAAEYLSYSLKDINQDKKTDIIFYFSTQDLIPSHPVTRRIDLDACLIVDILRTDKTISNYSLCEHALFMEQDNI